MDNFPVPHRASRPSTKQRGFTLIQLSIMLTAAALMMVTMLPAPQTRLNLDTSSTTKLNSTLTTLRQFEMNYGRLPCPADATQAIGSTSYGVEAANNNTTNNCTGGSPAANYSDSTNHIAIGMLPVKALGLSKDYALDSYGRTITYAVDTNAATCGWTNNPISGKLLVTDNGNLASTVGVLVSHGADGHGAWIPLTGTSGTAVRLNAGSTDTDQLTNAHVNSSFVATTVLTNFVNKAPTSTFDDLVVYKSNLWLLNQLPKASTVITTVAPPISKNYTTGQVLTFTITFSASVTVTGIPALDLTIGSSTRYAKYASGSGTSTLTFTYTVQSSDSANGITMAPYIDLTSFSGTIKVGNFCVPINFTAPVMSGITVNSMLVYVADSGNSRIEVFSSTGTYITQFGTVGSGNGQLYYPSGITLDSSGNIWIADTDNARIEEFSNSGAYVSQFAGSGAGQLGNPSNLLFDSSGNIWVADIGMNYSVKKFTGAGGNMLQAGPAGSANGQFWWCNEGGGNSGCGPGPSFGPSGLAVDGSGNIWVADKSNNRIEQFNSSGVWQKTIGYPTSCETSPASQPSCAAGSANGQFSSPESIAIDSSGNIWVNDIGNSRIEEFSSAGAYKSQFAATGYDMKLDASGHIWVADAMNNQVVEYSQTGSVITQFGNSGSGNGQFSYPGGIALSR